MNDLIIFGASGFGKEVAWLVERINNRKPTWNLLGFVDDNEILQGQTVNSYSVLGGCNCLIDYPNAYVVCAVGASKTRKMIVEKIKAVLPTAKFAILIDPTVQHSDLLSIGEGSIICAHTILTVNIKIGCHVILNLQCTVGHDAIVRDYATVYPSGNISGNTEIMECAEIGTGTQIIQGKKIGENTIIGAGSVVVKDIPKNCTAVGCPAKPIKFFE